VQADDAEDVLVSVFDRFFRAAQEDRFARLDDRDDLWQLLLMLTERKVALLRMEGYANKEITEKLGIALSSVERKLRVVREVWAEEFGE
jgi:FixJ family two-component response regulator